MDSQKQGGHKARAVGINHIAIEVGDIDKALDFYGHIFDFELRGRGEGMAFIDLGDQFIALTLCVGGAWTLPRWHGAAAFRACGR